MRSPLLPAAVVLLVLGLVFLLPGRDPGSAGPGGPFILPGSAAVGADVAAALLGLPRPELVEPPAWVLQRGGKDPILRSLDRLSWGSHDAIRASVETLEQHPEGLAEEVLSRLTALGESDIIHASKLVAMLAYDRGRTPGVLEELTWRALSESALVAKAALRVLGEHPDPVALAAILDRRNDPLEDVRDVARAALADQVRLGNEEALLYMLQDLEARPHLSDPRYLVALEGIEATPRALSVLRRIAEVAPYEDRVRALGVLLAKGDVDATHEVERMLESEDYIARGNGLRMAAKSGRVVGADQWREIVERGERDLCLFLLAILDRAIKTGDENADLAVELVERMAQDPTHAAQVESLDVLFSIGHPWGVERTRTELLTAEGPYLAQTVERIERVGGGLTPEFVELAFRRLEEPGLGDVERLLLCRLVAATDARRGADMLVRYVLEGVNQEGVLELVNQLVTLGPWGLARLEQEVGTDRGAALYVFVASHVGDAGCLPTLERISTDMSVDPVVRQHALDAIVRVHDGPREDTLRRVAQALGDPAVSDRAYLLFWNYL